MYLIKRSKFGLSLKNIKKLLKTRGLEQFKVLILVMYFSKNIIS